MQYVTVVFADGMTCLTRRVSRSPPAQHGSVAVANGERDEQQQVEQASSTRRIKQEAADGDRPRSASSVQSASSVSDQVCLLADVEFVEADGGEEQKAGEHEQQGRTVLPSLSKGSDQLPPLASGTMQRWANQHQESDDALFSPAIL